MTTKFIVMQHGLDYNDEVYSLGGDDAKVFPVSFDTKEEAKTWLREKVIEFYTNGSVNYDFSTTPYTTHPAPWDVGSFSYGEPDVEPAMRLDEIVGDGWDYSCNYKQVYDYCIENNLDPIQYMPWKGEGLFQIFEIEV